MMGMENAGPMKGLVNTVTSVQLASHVGSVMGQTKIAVLEVGGWYAAPGVTCQ